LLLHRITARPRKEAMVDRRDVNGQLRFGGDNRQLETASRNKFAEFGTSSLERPCIMTGGKYHQELMV
jgi:hypothetical protein